MIQKEMAARRRIANEARQGQRLAQRAYRVTQNPYEKQQEQEVQQLQNMSAKQKYMHKRMKSQGMLNAKPRLGTSFHSRQASKANQYSSRQVSQMKIEQSVQKYPIHSFQPSASEIKARVQTAPTGVNRNKQKPNKQLKQFATNVMFQQQVKNRVDKIQIERQDSLGVEGYYKKQGIKTNFSAGFVDLNPKYADARHQRAVQLASRWKGILGEKLKEKHEEIARQNFNDHIAKGNKLCVSQLKKLSQAWKSDYIKQQIIDTNNVNEYVDDVLSDVSDAEEGIEQLDIEVKDMQKDFYGEDFEKNAGYINMSMKEHATELAEKAKTDGSMQRAMKYNKLQAAKPKVQAVVNIGGAWH